MNWLLTLITFAFLVLMLLVVKGVGGRSRVSFQAQQQALGAMNGYIEVAQWWKDKAKEIYEIIPDFGGFLVKANSEGQPGPGDYNRSRRPSFS